VIHSIDGRPPGDPMTLPDRLRRRAEEDGPVTLGILRGGSAEPIEHEVVLRRADWYEQPLIVGNMSSPALGIAYSVPHRVESVVEGSPADKAGLRGGEVLASATLKPPSKEKLESLGLSDAPKEKKVEVPFEEQQIWPTFVYVALQSRLPGTVVELELADGRTVELEPYESDDWFNPDRGFLFEPRGFIQEARSVGEALALGWEETASSLMLVFRFLEKLGSGQVPLTAVGGPWSIAQWAYASASEGVAALLIFVCLISANLAVINFLPIPVLDGGHMVFLAYEGIRGKPPSERVHVGLSYLGLLFILGLMIFVLGLDFGCIPRQ
jgi:regulator of sigma E protease